MPKTRQVKKEVRISVMEGEGFRVQKLVNDVMVAEVSGVTWEAAVDEAEEMLD